MAVTKDFKIKLEVESSQSQEAFKKLDKVVNLTADQLAQLSKEVQSVNRALANVDFNNLNAAAAAQNVERLNIALDQNVGILTKTAQAIGTTAQQIRQTIAVTSDLVSVFERLTDPEFLRRAAVVVKVLGALAYSKGLTQVGMVLFGLSDQINDFSIFMEKMTSKFHEAFERAAFKAELLDTGLTTLKATVYSLGAVVVPAFAFSMFRGLQAVKEFIATSPEFVVSMISFDNWLYRTGESAKVLIAQLRELGNAKLLGLDATLRRAGAGILQLPANLDAALFAARKKVYLNVKQMQFLFEETATSIMEFFDDVDARRTKALFDLGASISLTQYAIKRQFQQVTLAISSFVQSLPDKYTQALFEVGATTSLLKNLVVRNLVAIKDEAVSTMAGIGQLLANSMRASWDAVLGLKVGFQQLLATIKKEFPTSFDDLVFQLSRLGRSISISLRRGLDEVNAAFVYIKEKFKGLTAPLLTQSKIDFEGFANTAKTSFAKVVEYGSAMGKAFQKGFTEGWGQFFQNIQAGFAAIGNSLLNLSAGGVKTATRSFIGLAEAGVTFGPTLVSLGAYAVQAESKFVKFAGTIALLAGVALGGFSAAVTLLLGKLGSLAESLGDTMIGAMNEFEQKAAKVISKMAQFQFVVTGFGKELGTEFVGSLEQWQAAIKQITDTSSQSIDSVASSVKLLIAEGAALHLPFETSFELLTRATDIAASQGRELTDVIMALSSGLQGQANSVLSLGLNLSETHMEHSKFLGTLGKLYSELTEQEKVQLRLNEVWEQTKPIIGAAQNELTTITGVTKKYEQALTNLQIRLGEQSDVTRAWILWQEKLLVTLAKMPQAVIDITGVLLDFGGVALKVIGILLKYTLTISSLSFVYTVLIGSVEKSIIMQKLLTIAFTFTGRAVGAQTVAVTGLSTAMLNLSLVLKASVITAVKSLGAVILGTLRSIATFTLTIMANPLFIKGALIAAGIYAVVNAVIQLKNELSFLTSETKKGSQETAIFSNLLKILEQIVSKISEVITDLAKVSILGFVQGFLLAARTVKEFQLAWSAKTPEKAAQLRSEIAELNYKLSETGSVAGGVQKRLFGLFSSTAEAATLAKAAITDFGQVLSPKMLEFKSMQKIMNDFDAASLRVELLGNDFQKARQQYLSAQSEFSKALEKLGNAESKSKELIEDVKKARERAAREYLTFQKLQLDSVQQFADKTTQLKQQELTANHSAIAVIALQHEQEMKAFDEKLTQMKEVFNLSQAQLAVIEETRQAIERSAAAQIASEQKKIQEEQTKVLEEFVTKNSELTIQLLEQKGLGKEAIDAQMKAQIALIDAKLFQLNVEGKLTGEILKQANLTKKLLADQAKGAKKQLGEPVQRAADAFSGIFDSLLSLDFAGVKESFTNMAQAMKEFTAADWGKFVGKGIKNAFAWGAQVIYGVLSGDYLNQFADLIEKVGNMPENLMKAFERLINSLMNFVGKLPSIVQKLLTSIPGMVDKFVDMFPKFIDQLMDVLPRIMKSMSEQMPRIMQVIFDVIPKIIRFIPQITQYLFDAIPVMIEMLMKALPDIIDSIFEAIPQIFQQLFHIIPTIIEQLSGSMDTIVLHLVEGFIAAIGDIVAAFIDEFLVKGGLERIVVALIKAIPRVALALVQGILRGLYRALKSIGSAIFGGFKGWKPPKALADLPDNIAEGAKKLGKSIAKETSQIFSVKDLEKAAKGFSEGVTDNVMKVDVDDLLDAAEEAGLTLWEQFKAAAIAAWEWFKSVGAQIWNGLVQATKTTLEVLKAIGLALWNGFLEATKLSYEWTVAIGKAIWDALVSATMASYEWTVAIGEAIWNAVITAAKVSYEWTVAIGEAIWGAVKSAFEKAGEVFFNLGTKIWDGLKKGLDGLGDFFKNMFDKLTPANLFEKIFKMDYKGKGTVEDVLKIDVPFAKFAKGLIPGQAMVPGDSEMNDRILALVSPGEAIIPRSKMDDPGIRSLVTAIMEDRLELPKFAGGVLGQLQKASKVVTAPVADAMGGLDPSKLWDKVKDYAFQVVMEAFKANSFHTGGLIPAFAGGGEVPIIAQPGEFVVNRRSTQNNLGLLSNINANTGAQSGGGVVIEKIEINAKTMLDADQIRREVIPAIERDLRRKSLDGQFIIASSGVRK